MQLGISIRLFPNTDVEIFVARRKVKAYKISKEFKVHNSAGMLVRLLEYKNINCAPSNNKTKTHKSTTVESKVIDDGILVKPLETNAIEQRVPHFQKWIKSNPNTKK